MRDRVTCDMAVDLNAFAEWIVVQAIPAHIEIRLRSVTAKIERIGTVIVGTIGGTQAILSTLIPIHGNVVGGHFQV